MAKRTHTQTSSSSSSDSRGGGYSQDAVKRIQRAYDTKGGQGRLAHMKAAQRSLARQRQKK